MWVQRWVEQRWVRRRRSPNWSGGHLTRRWQMVGMGAESAEFERPVVEMIMGGAKRLIVTFFRPEGLPEAIISTLERSDGSISLDYAWVERRGVFLLGPTPPPSWTNVHTKSVYA